MKNGIERIADERHEQVRKHGYSLRVDAQENSNGQLIVAATKMLEPYILDETPPENWSFEHWSKMVKKPLHERLIIAGALIAAEIDRLQSL